MPQRLVWRERVQCLPHAHVWKRLGLVAFHVHLLVLPLRVLRCVLPASVAAAESAQASPSAAECLAASRRLWILPVWLRRLRRLRRPHPGGAGQWDAWAAAELLKNFVGAGCDFPGWILANNLSRTLGGRSLCVEGKNEILAGRRRRAVKHICIDRAAPRAPPLAGLGSRPLHHPNRPRGPSRPRPTCPLARRSTRPSSHRRRRIRGRGRACATKHGAEPAPLAEVVVIVFGGNGVEFGFEIGHAVKGRRIRTAARTRGMGGGAINHHHDHVGAGTAL